MLPKIWSSIYLYCLITVKFFIVVVSEIVNLNWTRSGVSKYDVK